MTPFSSQRICFKTKNKLWKQSVRNHCDQASLTKHCPWSQPEVTWCDTMSATCKTNNFSFLNPNQELQMSVPVVHIVSGHFNFTKRLAELCFKHRSAKIKIQNCNTLIISQIASSTLLKLCVDQYYDSAQLFLKFWKRPATQVATL